MKKKSNLNLRLIIFIPIIIIIAIILLFYIIGNFYGIHWNNYGLKDEVDSYDECVAAGYPVHGWLDSRSRRCYTPDGREFPIPFGP